VDAQVTMRLPARQDPGDCRRRSSQLKEASLVNFDNCASFFSTGYTACSVWSLVTFPSLLFRP